MATTRLVVALNEEGRRIGESHHNSHISDDVVDQIRERHEDFGWSYERIARNFAIAKSTIQKICTYERRAQTPYRWKTIRVN